MGCRLSVTWQFGSFGRKEKLGIESRASCIRNLCFASPRNRVQEGVVFKKDSRWQKRPVLLFASVISLPAEWVTGVVGNPT